MWLTEHWSFRCYNEQGWQRAVLCRSFSEALGFAAAMRPGERGRVAVHAENQLSSNDLTVWVGNWQEAARVLQILTPGSPESPRDELGGLPLASTH